MSSRLPKKGGLGASVIKFSVYIFCILVHNRSFLDISANFNLLGTLELTFFGQDLVAGVNDVTF